MKSALDQKEKQPPQACFEDLCPDFHLQLQKEGYGETLKHGKFEGKISGQDRNLANSKCCIVGEAFKLN